MHICVSCTSFCGSDTYLGNVFEQLTLLNELPTCLTMFPCAMMQEPLLQEIIDINVEIDSASLELRKHRDALASLDTDDLDIGDRKYEYKKTSKELVIMVEVPYKRIWKVDYVLQDPNDIATLQFTRGSDTAFVSFVPQSLTAVKVGIGAAATVVGGLVLGAIAGTYAGAKTGGTVTAWVPRKDLNSSSIQVLKKKVEEVFSVVTQKKACLDKLKDQSAEVKELYTAQIQAEINKLTAERELLSRPYLFLDEVTAKVLRSYFHQDQEAHEL